MTSVQRSRVSWSLETGADDSQTGLLPLRLSPAVTEEGSSPGPQVLDPDLDSEPVLLPRSSPVVCRRSRALWNGPNRLSTMSLEPGVGLRNTETSTAVCEEETTEELSHKAEKQRSPDVGPKISEEVFKSCCDLEQENVHFVLVDLVLEVLEGAKWRLSSEDETLEPEPSQVQVQQSRLGSHTVNPNVQRWRSGEEQRWRTEQRGLWEMKSVAEISRGCSKAQVETATETVLNAESLAQALVQSFTQSWFPSELQRGRRSLRTSLRELPGGDSVVTSDLKKQIQTRSRMRGALSWTPPSVQIILTTHHQHRRSEVVASQQFLCAGCGTELEPKYIRRLRFCEYLGRYFCDCCHSGAEAVIPARVLSAWDFTRYPVSDFSHSLLSWFWSEPLFDLCVVESNLRRQTKDLQRFMVLHSELIGLQTLLRKCTYSERSLLAFSSLPPHLLQSPPLVSMSDLLRLKKGLLQSQARTVIQSGLNHAQHCQCCQGQGFTCGLCKDPNPFFFFQSDVYKICPGCKKSFHRLCLVGQKCPKCAGARSKRRLQDGSLK